MGVYSEAIADNSIWLTLTPNEHVKNLPFYITEIGHFFAQREYRVERMFHNSHLFVFTVRGCGEIVSDSISSELPDSCACMIDCKKPHKYFSKSENWEFVWFHMGGCAVSSIFETIYNTGSKPIQINNKKEFEHTLARLMGLAADSSLMSAFKISYDIHGILNTVFESSIAPSDSSSSMPYYDDIKAAAEYIKNNYAKPITIDDLIAQAHMSKFYFVRIFHKMMGMPPYSYITNYRINQAKILLHSTKRSVSEISEQCGFMDTSNFIAHFKKHTGQTPLQYRRDFL